MPQLQNKTFAQLVSDFALAVQGTAGTLLDFTVGSILRALAESVSGVAVWLESLIIILLATTRAASSSGNDLDTFVNDFGVYREGAIYADGTVTFARYTPQSAAVIPVGANVVTGDQTQTYTVIADTNQPNYVAAQNAYVIPAGSASCTATVQATNLGSQGNVNANTITIIATAIPFVDTVNNAQPFTNGADAETDAALRARFIAWFQSLSKATRQAIIACVLQLQVGATCTVTENAQYNGTASAGFFYAVVDDGSGAPPSSFTQSATNAIDATRACGVQFNVFSPIQKVAAVSMAVSVASGFDPVATKAAVQVAVSNYIQALGLGIGLAWSRLYQVAYDASPGVTEVTGLTLNGGTSDLTADNKTRIVAGNVQVN